jgi:hypothetical protein
MNLNFYFSLGIPFMYLIHFFYEKFYLSQWSVMTPTMGKNLYFLRLIKAFFIFLPAQLLACLICIPDHKILQGHYNRLQDIFPYIVPCCGSK